MVIYNPKDWFKLIFLFHKSDTLRILAPTLLLLGIITGGVCYFASQYPSFQLPPLGIFHQISGFIISLVLVFRINTAYDRWWEGRKMWGALLNNSRNIAIQLDAMLPKNEKGKRKIMADLIGNFAFTLKEHLRNNVQSDEINFNEACTKDDFDAAAHKPSFVTGRLTDELYKELRQDPTALLLLNENVNEFMDICGACERIRNTPIPYSYSIFIKKIIFLYVITMPFSFAFSLGYYSIPIVMIMFYAFASLELISEEIEDPFGTDANDLPTQEIAQNIRKNVQEILSQ